MFLTLLLFLHGIILQQSSFTNIKAEKSQPESVHNFSTMASSTIKDTADPKAALSNKDLALLLMEYSKDRFIEERAYTKELINDKAEVIIKGLVKGLGEGLSNVTELINKQAQRLESLELKVDNCSCHEQLPLKPPHVITCNVCN